RLSVRTLSDILLPDPVNYNLIPGFFRALAAERRSFRPDVVLINKFMFFSSLAVFALRGRVPVVVLTDTFPGLTWFPRRRSVKLAMRVYARLLGVRVLRAADHVVLFHEGLLPMAASLGLSATVIRPGLAGASPFSAASPAPALTAVRARGERVILYVGRLETVKGVDMLIEALAPALEGWRARLVLAGGGAGERALRARSRSPRVDILGYRTDVPALLAAADVFVLASVAEGVPNALLEAMAAGCACVATAVGGVPTVIEPDVSGLLVPPRDPSALRAAVAALLADDARRAKLGAAARRRIETRYAETDMVDGYTRLFERLLGRAPVAVRSPVGAQREALPR
ncbi:MAG: glycosyltransferase, partial [Dehalococcoidia bacterium]|nr:glycosyltransferase [Dehalococcoidia bacterium]